MDAEVSISANILKIKKKPTASSIVTTLNLSWTPALLMFERKVPSTISHTLVAYHHWKLLAKCARALILNQGALNPMHGCSEAFILQWSVELVFPFYTPTIVPNPFSQFTWCLHDFQQTGKMALDACTNKMMCKTHTI